jgi:hypothetical protein
VVKHQIYEVREWEHQLYRGRKFFSVYWEHGVTGLKYVFPNIAARDELEAYTIGLQKIKEGAEQ